MVAAFTLAACARAGGDASSVTPSHAHVGQPAPGWNEPSLPGSRLALSSLRGKTVYLNFFATWCPPCNDEAPAIDALQRAYGARGLQVVGVDVLENSAKAAAFRNSHHLNYPIVIDGGGLRDQYNVNGLPVHVFIDRNGIVRKIVVGTLSAAEMRANVEQIL
jgi:cytochrome c biogenesis protein CcmG, thiol:disulfide interchange protein DsbE